MSAGSFLWLALALLLLVGVAHAQPDAAARDAARSIARDGLAAYDRGDYAEALANFDRADALVTAPTMGLMAARSLERLGRWVEAAARYQRVATAVVAPEATAAMRAAPEKAARERETLLPRIPTVDIAAPADVEAVELDGRPYPRDRLGSTQPIDPGDHELRWQRLGRAGSARFTAAPRQHQHLVAGRSIDGPLSPSPRRPIGITLLATGGAAILAGAVVGIASLVARSHLDDGGCTHQLCPPELAGDVARYNAMRLASGATLIAGTAFAGAGIALLVSAAPDRARPAASLTFRATW